MKFDKANLTGRRRHGLILALIAALLLLFTSASALLAQGYWYGTYWNNRNLSGQPVLVREDPAIDFDWRGLSPDVSVNVDNFSARWTRTYHFSQGVYRFKATMDDGMRVWVDDKLIINDWQDGKVRTIEADVSLSSGPHQLVVEYYEFGGKAVAGFTWDIIQGGAPVYPPSYPPQQPGQPPQQPGQPPQQPGQPPQQPGHPPNQPGQTAWVTASYLNVRSGPGVEYSVVTKITKGTEVQRVDPASPNKWVEIVVPGVAKGWVNRYYLTTERGGSGGTGSVSPPKGDHIAVVSTSSLHVRYGPSIGFGSFAVVHRGDRLGMIGRSGNGYWLKARIPTGAEGWVAANFVDSDTPVNSLPVVN